MLVQDLRRRQVEVFLRHMHPPLPQGIHAGLSTDPFQLRPTATIHLLSDLREIDSPRQIHAPAVNPQDIRPSLHRGWGEFNLPIDPPRPQQGGIEDVQTIRRHDDLDILRRFEPIELIQQFQHRPLHLAIPATRPFHAGGPNAIDFIHEDDGRRMLAGHDEQFADHARPFANILLHQLRA